MEIDRDLWAIEVKSSKTVDTRDVRGLAAFAERTGRVTRQIVIFLGSRRQRFGEVEIIPLAEFLSELPNR